MGDQNSVRNVQKKMKKVTKFGILPFWPLTLADTPNLTSPIVFSCENTPRIISSHYLSALESLCPFQNDVWVSQVASRFHSKVHFSHTFFVTTSAVRIGLLRDLTLNISTHRVKHAPSSWCDVGSKLRSGHHKTWNEQLFTRCKKKWPKCRFDPLDGKIAVLTIHERLPRIIIRLGINRHVVYLVGKWVGQVPEDVDVNFWDHFFGHVWSPRSQFLSVLDVLRLWTYLRNHENTIQTKSHGVRSKLHSPWRKMWKMQLFVIANGSEVKFWWVFMGFDPHALQLDKIWLHHCFSRMKTPLETSSLMGLHHLVLIVILQKIFEWVKSQADFTRSFLFEPRFRLPF